MRLRLGNKHHLRKPIEQSRSECIFLSLPEFPADARTSFSTCLFPTNKNNKNNKIPPFSLSLSLYCNCVRSVFCSEKDRTVRKRSKSTTCKQPASHRPVLVRSDLRSEGEGPSGGEERTPESLTLLSTTWPVIIPNSPAQKPNKRVSV